MATDIFYADFDGNGPGFQGASLPNEDRTNAVFSSWSIGGAPILAGRWELSYPEYNDAPNRTGGSGRYASVHSNSSEFIDTQVWMISPLIDVGKYKDITLLVDIYFKAQGAGVGEDTLTISILTINDKSTSAESVGHHTVDVLGKNMSVNDPELQGTLSWNLSKFSNASHFIQLAFSWYSSMGPASVQLDNIRVQGEENVTLAPPSNFKVQKP
ncbi:MAG: hypothetical protein KKD44_11105 [Proteobacteria bacterium]|nr:hypothetical protein [Pseudomonadota bacterium]